MTGTPKTGEPAAASPTAPVRPGILVTGGAGYIGSHLVARLLAAGEDVVVLDDLRNGCRAAAVRAAFHRGDIRDRALLNAIVRLRRIGTIVHLAASTSVAESMADPAAYYRNNAGGTAILLECAAKNGIRHFLFASSAAVYGGAGNGPCREDAPAEPANPYGRSKRMSEHLLANIGAASGMRHVVLRCFNVAGAAPAGAPGPRGRASGHLFNIACEAAAGRRDRIDIHGVDYPTPDGTCIRDYVHVEDVAAAHVAALRYLRAGGASVTLNCGRGEGTSVRQAIAAVERAAGRTLPVREAARRPGDAPATVACTDRIRRVLDWRPQHDSLDLIARSALAGERPLPNPQEAGRGAARDRT